MSRAIFYQILESVQASLVGLPGGFQPQSNDTIIPMPTENIVITKAAFRNSPITNDPSYAMPAWLISPIKAERPPSKGTNVRDDAYYTIWLQLVASDNDHRDVNLETFLKWGEQAARLFNEDAPDDIVADDTYECVWTTHAVDHQVLDQRMYRVHKNFVSGIELVFVSRETRGATT